jgi:hypothetical protein
MNSRKLVELMSRFPVWLAMLAVIVFWLQTDDVRADPADVISNGAMYNGTCYSSNAAAQDVFFASQPPQIFNNASTTYYGFFQKSGAAWLYTQYSISAAGRWTLMFSQAPSALPVFPVCSYDPDYSPAAMAVNQDIQLTNMATAVSGIQQSMTMAASAASSVAQSMSDSATFDLTNALAAFAFFFSSIVLIFMTSSSAGEILKLIRGNGR